MKAPPRTERVLKSAGTFYERGVKETDLGQGKESSLALRGSSCLSHGFCDHDRERRERVFR